MNRLFRWLLVWLALYGVAGCAVNPVTGREELALVSQRQEIDIGRRQYMPSRQLQGGDYRADPALVEYVQQVGQRLAAVSDRQLPYEFSVVNDGTPNAWALPGGKIAVNRGLLAKLRNEAELAAVLSHEIVHAAARHGAQAMERGLLLQGALAAVDAAVDSGSGKHAGLILGAASLGSALISRKYSREAELEADRYGMIYMQRAGYDPQAAVTLQETFVKLAEGREENWLSGLFASHPPSPERVARNREMAATLGTGGRLGRDRYRRMTARLRRDEPAYAAYRQGRRLLNEQPAKALKLAARAISIEPGEGLFYGLRGDALYRLKRYRKAQRAYQRAVTLNPDYFRYHLRRGLVAEKLGDEATARRELERSIQLLPTADAHYLLGRMLQQQGRPEAALSHFQAAAESDSALARKAWKQVVRLDLGDHPNRYLKVTKKVGNNGRLLLHIRNPTFLGVRNLLLRVGRVNYLGIPRDGGKLVSVEQTIRPGKGIWVETPFTGIATRHKLHYYDAEIIALDIVPQ